MILYYCLILIIQDTAFQLAEVYIAYLNCLTLLGWSFSVESCSHIWYCTVIRRQHVGLNVRRMTFRWCSKTTLTIVYTTCLRPSTMTLQTAATELSNKEKSVTVATLRLRSDEYDNKWSKNYRRKAASLIVTPHGGEWIRPTLTPIWYIVPWAHPFVHRSPVCPTQTHKHTDHATSVAVGRIYAMHAIQPNDGLRGSANLVLTATGFVNRNGQFTTPTESTPFNRSPNNLSHVITAASLRLCQIRYISVHGGCWAYGWNITKIIFIYIS